jgi:hypothetical protein
MECAPARMAIATPKGAIVKLIPPLFQGLVMGFANQQYPLVLSVDCVGRALFEAS